MTTLCNLVYSDLLYKTQWYQNTQFKTYRQISHYLCNSSLWNNPLCNVGASSQGIGCLFILLCFFLPLSFHGWEESNGCLLAVFRKAYSLDNWSSYSCRTEIFLDMSLPSCGYHRASFFFQQMPVHYFSPEATFKHFMCIFKSPDSTNWHFPGNVSSTLEDVYWTFYKKHFPNG